MTKYGRRLRFGYVPIPTAVDPMRPLRLAAQAETLGLEYVGIQGHPYNAEHHDAWTLLAATGMATSHISLFINVADLPLRPPAMLAKAAASLDLLTGGRIEVGLAAGASWDQLVAMGGEKRSEKEALAALEEAIQVMRLMWSDEDSVRFAGKFYQLASLHPGPAPAHRIGIWLGGNEPQALALVGRLADGWIADHYPIIQPGNLAMLSKHVDDAAASAGRQPSEIQRIWNITGTIGNADSREIFQGSAKQWAESLAELAINVGIDTFLLMEGENAEEQLQKFALEVAPYMRELVEPASAVPSGLARAHQGAGASGATPAEEKTGDVDWVDETSMESFPASDPPASSSTI